MKVITKDEKKAEQEQKEKLKKLEEDNKRKKFLESLKDNRNFQKYIIEEIIDKEIADAQRSTFPNMATLVAASADEVKNLAITKSANELLLKKIKRLIVGD